MLLCSYHVDVSYISQIKMRQTKINVSAIIIFPFLVYNVKALCATKKSCCQGTFQNDLCEVKGDVTCYCDGKCMFLGDCCSDYRDFCLSGPPVPCSYSPWEQWSRCSTREVCDIGYRTRERRIIQTGNGKSNRCRYSDLTETKLCGDTLCHNFHMKPITNMIKYKDDHFQFTNAVYQFVSSKTGDCSQFEHRWNSICILCSDEGRCGNKVIKSNDTIDIWQDSCLGNWRKTTTSVSRRTCEYIMPYRKHFSFFHPQVKEQ